MGRKIEATCAGVAFVRAAWMVVLLAGCATGPIPAADPVTSPDVIVAADGCPLTYPDGSPMPCDLQEFVAATGNARPPLAEGWRCTASWGENGLLAAEYMKPDGSLGFYWEWERWKPDGLAFQRLALYTAVEQGMSYHIPYQATGFFVYPEIPSPSGPVEIQQTFRLMRIHAHVDGQWVQDPDNATILLGHVGGDWYWVARFDWPGGPYYVDTMHEDMEDGQLGKWQGRGWQGTIAGTPVIIDSMGNGIKYVNIDYSRRRANVDECALPAVPS